MTELRVTYEEMSRVKGEDVLALFFTTELDGTNFQSFTASVPGPHFEAVERLAEERASVYAAVAAAGVAQFVEAVRKGFTPYADQTTSHTEWVDERDVTALVDSASSLPDQNEVYGVYEV